MSPFRPSRALACALALAFATTALAAQGALPRPGREETPLIDLLPLRRVMPLGDSITQGGRGFASWRYALWRSLPPELRVDFVGIQNWVFPADGPGNPDLASYPLYFAQFDREHQAFWGARTDQLIDDVFRAVELVRPDIMLLHIGTNDIGQLGLNGLVNFRLNMPRIVSEVRASRPAVTFLLAQIIPIGRESEFGGAAGLVGLLNKEVERVSKVHSTPASPIVVVDHNTGFDTGTLLQPDGLHPNLAGEERMAAVWLASLIENYVAPPPPRVPLPDVPDGSFEALDLPDLLVVQQPSATPWRSAGTSATFRGLYNPGGDTYLDAHGNGVPRGGKGHDVAFLFDAGPGNESCALYQTLATTCERGRRYALTVAIGRRFDTNPYGTTYGGFRLELLAGNDVLGVLEDSLVPPPGEFQDATLVVDTRTMPVRIQGQALTVRMRLATGAAGSATDFDWVRLEME